MLSSMGAMNCRGLLEHLLRDVHHLAYLFNATATCKTLGKGQGKAEVILVKMAKLIFEEFPNANLTKISQKEPNILYKFIYSRLSQRIHEAPNYGVQVGRMICMQLSCIFRLLYH